MNSPQKQSENELATKSVSYQQSQKNMIRHRLLVQAIELLTCRRKEACCVERNYVRNLYEHFYDEESSTLHAEIQKIDPTYIDYWERLHDSYISNKKPEDLTVCYLSGPEPQNDFDELTAAGILPQNIWAFESDKRIYNEALAACIDGAFPQPRLLKQSVEMFFQHTPKKFDIIYIDACGTIPSAKRALRCIATMSKYHRLISPGVLVSNFACPTDIDDDYVEMIAEYLFFKKFPNEDILSHEGAITNLNYIRTAGAIRANFSLHYGNFITACLCDIVSIVIPIQRFVNSRNWDDFVEKTPRTDDITIEQINAVKNCSLRKMLMWQTYAKKATRNKRTGMLHSEMSSDAGESVKFTESILRLFELKADPSLLKMDVKAGIDKAESLYQYLDKPTGDLYFDYILNQVSFPLHYCLSQIRRYRYKAKETFMFSDIIPLDECRYIYEWLPGIHQIPRAYEDNSWKDIFRFALDGLVKQRMNMNNEFFFQGSVIDKHENGFHAHELADRIVMNGEEE